MQLCCSFGHRPCSSVAPRCSSLTCVVKHLVLYNQIQHETHTDLIAQATMSGQQLVTHLRAATFVGRLQAVWQRPKMLSWKRCWLAMPACGKTLPPCNMSAWYLLCLLALLNLHTTVVTSTALCTKHEQKPLFTRGFCVAYNCKSITSFLSSSLQPCESVYIASH